MTLCRFCLEPVHSREHLAHECVENIRVAERARIAAWFRHAARSTRIDAAAGLWDGIEDEVDGVIDTFNGYADTIESGAYLAQGTSGSTPL